MAFAGRPTTSPPRALSPPVTSSSSAAAFNDHSSSNSLASSSSPGASSSDPLLSSLALLTSTTPSANQHVVQIPQAVEIAAAPETPNIPAQLRQEAVEYLNNVRLLSEETWKACLALYMQGTGRGRDGKQKLGGELRVFCLAVVDDVLGNKPQVVSKEDLRALYSVMVAYVEAEFVQGSAEDGIAFIRNKFCYTLTLVFLLLYPEPISDFLQPFLSFLEVAASSSDYDQPALHVTLHLLSEIAAEVHDPLLKSSRAYTPERNSRDANVRDALRTSGVSKQVISGLLAVVAKGIDTGSPSEAVDWALRALAAWAPWVDINDSVTPTSLDIFKRLAVSSSLRHSAAAFSIYTAILSKGSKTAAEKLQILQVLDVMSFVIPIEEKSRLSSADYDRTNDEEQHRKGLARVLCAQGVESFKIVEDAGADPATRSAAETLFYATLPMMIRFLEDTHDEVSLAMDPLLTEIMKMYKKTKKGNESGFTLPQDKAQFFATLLETLVKKLQWPANLEWTLDGEDEDDETDKEDLEAFLGTRRRLRSDIDSIAFIDPSLFNSVVVGFINETFSAWQQQGAQAVSWQRAELATYLVFIYAETQKVVLTKDAFFELPAQVQEQLKERQREKADHFRAQKQKTVNGSLETESLPAKVYPPIDFISYPLTAQGEIVFKGIQSQILSYPHSAVTLNFLESCARYFEFFKCRRDLIQPVLEAFVDSRGIHNPKRSVRNRVFYLFSKFVKDARSSIDSSFVVAILNGISDALGIKAELPEAENPDEDVLAKATTGPQAFDHHLHLFEAVGSLVGLVKSPEEQVQYLQVVISPLVAGLHSVIGKTLTPLDVLQAHHLILAIGALSRGFPDAPERGWQNMKPPAWHEPFEQGIEAIIKALETLKGFKCIRDAARLAFAGIINAMSGQVVRFIPPLVVHMVGEFDSNELVESFGFLGMLAHKLKMAIYPIMDELLPLLLERAYALLAAVPNGTDEALMLTEIRRTYPTFISTLFTEGLQDVLVSERNKPGFEAFVQSLLALASEDSDRTRQRAAIGVLNRSIAVWALDSSVSRGSSIFTNDNAARNGVRKESGSSGTSTPVASGLPGYERMVYNQIVPTMFSVIMKPEFSLKDGQSQLVVFEVANTLRDIAVARGQEGLDFTLAFLSSQGCPPQVAEQLIVRLRGEAIRDFKKTFSEFIKDWKASITQ